GGGRQRIDDRDHARTRNLGGDVRHGFAAERRGHRLQRGGLGRGGLGHGRRRLVAPAEALVDQVERQERDRDDRRTEQDGATVAQQEALARRARLARGGRLLVEGDRLGCTRAGRSRRRRRFGRGRVVRRPGGGRRLVAGERPPLLFLPA